MTPERLALAGVIVRAIVLLLSGDKLLAQSVDDSLVEQIVAGAAAIGAIVWSVYQKREAAKALAAAKAAPAEPPPT